MTFPDAPLCAIVEIYYDGAWHDISTDVDGREDIVIRHGRADEASHSDPSQCNLVLKSPDGKYSPRNPLSPLYGKVGRNTPLRVTASSSLRFSGEVPSWPSRWESELDVTVPIEAVGITRRLGQGQSPLASAFRRGVTGANVTRPVAYWPCEDGDGATLLAEAYGGSSLRIIGDVTPAEFDGLNASAPLPVFGVGRAIGAVPAYTVPTTQRVIATAGFPETLAVEAQLVEFFTTGTARRWRMMITNLGSLGVRAYNVDNVEILNQNINFGGLLGRKGMVWLLLTQDGADVDWELGFAEQDAEFPFAFSSTLAGRTAGRATNITLGSTVDLNGCALGHLAVLDSDEFWDIIAFVSAWRGETAADRMTRLGAEEGISVTVDEDETTAAAGPQGRATFLNLVRDAAAVDLGVLSDQRDALGLHYRARSTMYNQASALVLDYDAGQAYAPLHPEDDDQATRNDVTVTRDGGSSYRAVKEDGPLSILAPPSGVGRYDDSVTLNLYTDDQAQDQAGWRLHLGTVDEARYPRVRLNLHGSPELIDAAKLLDLGDLITITNTPPWLPPGDINLIVQGYTETMNSKTWDIVWNCTPGSAWTVAELDDDVLGRIDTDGSQLTVPVDASSTTLLVGRTSDRDEDFEDANLAVTLTGTWARSQVSPQAGLWCLASADISDGQTSDAVITVPTGSTVVRVWYRVSSESGFDFFRILLDGDQVLEASGAVAWTSVDLDITGITTLTLRYVKNGSGTAGEDAAYVDSLNFRGGGDWPFWTTDPAELPLTVVVGGEEVEVTAIAGTDSPQVFTVTRATNGIVKTHDAGTDLRLAQPAIVAW